MLRAGPLSGFQSLAWNSAHTCHFERGEKSSLISSNLKSERFLLSTEMTEVDWPPRQVWISRRRYLLFVKLFEQAALFNFVEEVEVNKLFGLGGFCGRNGSRHVIERVLHALHIHIGRPL